ncbi:hypothetical protein Tco_1372943 [Tanacetum coccineum]
MTHLVVVLISCAIDNKVTPSDIQHSVAYSDLRVLQISTRAKDKHEFPAKEQPLPPVDSPTAESLGYVTESDLEED